MSKSESAFPLWRRGIPRLARALSKAKALGKLIPEDDVQGQAGLIELDLRINREVRETLLAEMRVRREAAELRKLEYDGMDESAIEQELTRVAYRRGYRSVDGIRRHAVEYLTSRGASADSAQLLVDEVIPPVKSERKRKPLESYVRARHDQLEEDLAEGIRALSDSLEAPGDTQQETDASPAGSTAIGPLTVDP